MNSQYAVEMGELHEEVRCWMMAPGNVAVEGDGLAVSSDVLCIYFRKCLCEEMI